MLEKNLVSVIIPCYNQAHYLGKTIESVLSQTYPKVEIIVVNDGSPDDTRAVVARYPQVKYVYQENQGLSGARNTGFSNSTGEYVVFLDSDDKLLPHALAIGVRSLTENPVCALTSGWCNFIDPDGRPLPTWRQLHVTHNHYCELLRGNYIWCPGMVVYRREAIEKVSGFDTSLKSSEDYDIYLRIAREFPIHCHGQVVADYRRHESSMSRNAERMLKATLRVLDKQKAFAYADSNLKAAHATGINTYLDLYGEQIINRVRANVRDKRDWNQIVKDVMVLLRHYPKGVRDNCVRKLKVTLGR